MATLTTVKGINRTLVETIPSSRGGSEFYGSRLVFFSDTYLVGAGNDFGVNGLIRLFNIPRFGRVVDFEVSVADCGTTGDFKVGWAASREVDKSTGVVLEASSAAGLISTVNCHTAAVSRQKITATDAGYLKRFLAEVEVQADFTAATDAAAGITFKFAAIIAVED